MFCDSESDLQNVELDESVPIKHAAEPTLGVVRNVINEDTQQDSNVGRVEIVEVPAGQSVNVDHYAKTEVVVKDEHVIGGDGGVRNANVFVCPSLMSRMSPAAITRLMKKCFSKQQKKEISSIGFGSLEFLDVQKMPLHLAYWIVYHFDANTCSLNIPGEKSLVITEQDVHDVLGLPIGGEEIDLSFEDKDVDLLDSWKKQFPLNTLCVSVGDLATFLKNTKGASAMFKRNFVVLCCTVLMSGTQNKNVNHWILRYPRNVDHIKKLNWCNYILKSLVEAKKYWQAKPNRFFPGSIFFLMVSKYMFSCEVNFRFCVQVSF